MEQVQGKLSDETKTGSLEGDEQLARLVVHITDQEFEIIKTKVRARANKKYQLNAHDCVTFTEDIASSVLRLTTPDRNALFERWSSELKKQLGRPAEEREAWTPSRLFTFASLPSLTVARADERDNWMSGQPMLAEASRPKRASAPRVPRSAWLA